MRHDGTRPIDAADSGANNQEQKDDPWATMMQQASAISGIPVPGSNVHATSKPMLERRAGRSQAGMFTETLLTIITKIIFDGLIRIITPYNKNHANTLIYFQSHMVLILNHAFLLIGR